MTNRNYFESVPSTSRCFFLPFLSASVATAAFPEVKVNNEGLQAICDICGRGFANETYVNRHKKTVHTDKNKERQQCPKCPLNFSDMRKFWQHVVLVHETQGEGGDESDPRVNTMWTIATNDEPKCKDCGMKFADVKGLKKHIKDIHSSSKTDFPCNLCNIVLCSADGLFRHKRNVHRVQDLPATSSTPPTQCPYCSEIFYHQGYEAHILQLHSEHYEEYLASVMKKPEGTGRQPSTCQSCKLNFSDWQTLQRHITRMHDQSGKFRCSECEKDFGDQKELTNHWTVHKNAIMEPHIKAMLRTVFGTVCSPSMTCGICQTVVYSSIEAKLHLYVQHPDKFKEMIPNQPSGSGFACTVCSVRQNTREEMIQHMELNHKEENLPTCGLCGHKELKERDMNYHYKRYHSEATRYICEVCHQSFTQKRGLVKHVRREHSGEAEQCPYCRRSISR